MRSRPAGLGSIVLGAGIAVSAVLGPLVLKVIRFHTSANLENQFVGGEVVSLAIVAPAAMAAGALWLRGHRAAPVLALGPALYAVYTYTTVVVGQEYTRYGGNAEKFFPLYVGLVAGGAAMTAFAWSQLVETTVPIPSNALRRTLAAVFLGIGSLFALNWTAQIRLVIVGKPTAEYADGPTLFWLIKLLDFGFVIPLLMVTGVGLLRRHEIAIKAAYGLAAFVTCLTGSVAGMAIAMVAKGDPSAQPAMLIVVLPATIGLALGTMRLLRSYLQGASERPRSTADDRLARRIGTEPT